MKRVLSCFVAAAMCASPLVVVEQTYAQTAPGMNDLVGARGSSLDDALQQRGYEFARNEGAASMYWNDRDNRCVSALVDNGRVQSIETASSSDCGKNGSGAAIAGVAAGAVAVGLLAALASRHKDDDRNNNASYNSEYERGYNDAIYGSHYATNDSEAYHSGYMAGEAERNNRRHANSQIVRGAPASAQEACKTRGDRFWDIPRGSTVPVSAFDYGQGNYEIVVASGHRRANCSVNSRGDVSDFLPQ